MTAKTSTKAPSVRERLYALHPDNLTWKVYLDQALTDDGSTGDPGPTIIDLYWCITRPDPDGLDQHRAAANLGTPGWNIAISRLEQRIRDITRTLDQAADNSDDPAAASLAAIDTLLPELGTLTTQLAAAKQAKPYWASAIAYRPLRDGQQVRARQAGAWAEPLLLHRFHAFEAGLEPDPLPADWTVALLVAAWRYSRRSNRYLDTALNPQSATIG